MVKKKNYRLWFSSNICALQLNNFVIAEILWTEFCLLISYLFCQEIGVVHRRWHLWRRIYDLYLGYCFLGSNSTFMRMNFVDGDVTVGFLLMK